MEQNATIRVVGDKLKVVWQCGTRCGKITYTALEKALRRTEERGQQAESPTAGGSTD